MIKRNKNISILITLFLCVIALFISVLIRDYFLPNNVYSALPSFVVSPISSDEVVENIATISQMPEKAEPTREIKILDKPTETPIQKISDFKISFIDAPRDLLEGSQATFTWSVQGSPEPIDTSTVYIGTKNISGSIDKTIKPSDLEYTIYIKDFIKGSYMIPMQFVGSVNIPNPGTYYARAYTYINGNHIWSDEHTFTVRQIPRNEIKIVNPPSSIYKGANVPFTWEIVGPAGTTTFTTIVLAKDSKPGLLDTTIDIPQTPYTVLIKDFTNGNYTVPLRFIGNAMFNETGEYYYRALTFMNNKNIWSEEYKLIVQ
jgi:hypothetical protein